MISWLKELLSKRLCFHKWIDKCTCGESYQSFCFYRKKYGSCKRTSLTGSIYCDYYYKVCEKCGKEIDYWSMND